MITWLKYYKPHFVKLGEGGAQPNISRNKIISRIVPLPPLAEQRRIAERVAELMPLVDEYGDLEEAREMLDSELPGRLRKSVLQQAVQGRLVPQDPNDEPASALLGRVREERARLVAEGRAKFPKGGESVIYRASDGGHYEKRIDAKGHVLSDERIEDEIPFEVPEGWEWARLDSIVYQRPQVKPTTKISYIDIGSIDNVRHCLNAAENLIEASKAPSRARKPVEIGDILYSTVRPYLHNMCIVDREFSLPPIASTGFAVMVCFADMLNKYLFTFLMSPDFDAYANRADNSKGVAYPAINDRRLYAALIPVPPLAEQCRIVNRVNDVFSQITNQ